MTEPGSAFITRVRMAESGSPRRSSDSDDEYDLTLSSSLSSEVSEEVRLSWPSLEMEVLPYRFEPGLPSLAGPDPFFLRRAKKILARFRRALKNGSGPARLRSTRYRYR